jgi:hypothetical protein
MTRSSHSLFRVEAINKTKPQSFELSKHFRRYTAATPYELL